MSFNEAEKLNYLNYVKRKQNYKTVLMFKWPETFDILNLCKEKARFQDVNDD